MAMYGDGGGYRLRGGNGGINAIPEGEMDALLLGKTRELVAATPSQRNWKGILIALLVICAVLSLIIFSIYLLLPPDEGPRVKGRKVTVEDITSGRFRILKWNGSWVSEEELIFRDHLEGLSLLNVKSLKQTPLITNSTFRQLNAHKWWVSTDRRLVLFAHEEQPAGQYSFKAKYTVYDVDNQAQMRISPGPGDLNLSPGEDQALIQFATWVPATTSIIFVYNNDIYYKPDPRGSKDPIRLTISGEPGLIYNGIPDPLYEDEVFKPNSSASWLSPDGQYLAYARFNDSDVGVSSYHWYGDGKQAYPSLRSLRIPKAGTANPVVSLSFVNLRSNTLDSRPIRPPRSLDLRDHYLSGVRWVTKDLLSVVWMNRMQNLSIILTCRPPGFLCQEVHTIKAGGSGWVGTVEPPLFSRDGNRSLFLAPWRDGEAGYFRHVILLDIPTRREIPVTRGPFEVTQIIGWDQSQQLIYFIATPQGSPGQRHLYKISERSSNSSMIVAPTCLSCPTRNFTSSSSNSSQQKKLNQTRRNQQGHHFLREEWEEIGEGPDPSQESMGMDSIIQIRNTSGNGTLRRGVLRLPPCLYNSVRLSSDFRYVVRECLGPSVPFITLHSLPSGRLLYMLQNHTALRQEVADMGLPLVRTFFVELSESYKAPVKLFLPPGLREEEDFKFPLILHVNAAPDSQLVSERFEISWTDYIVSQKNYIVAEIDGRGSGFQGEALRHSIYKHLGTLEVGDQIMAVRDLVSRLHFIDHDNMAVWGWGYGGYAALKALASDSLVGQAQRLFQCAIIIAPIFKWEFHNSAYTERYMGLPNSDNRPGYNNADFSENEIKNLMEKNLLIVHGTADQSVHLQHTLHLTKALVNKGAAFTEQIYPDEGHDLGGVLTHLFATMEAFIESNFDAMDWEDYEKANFLGIQM